MNRRHVHVIEMGLLAVGLLLVTSFVTVHVCQKVLSQSAVDSFYLPKEPAISNDSFSLRSRPLSLDLRLWSKHRIAAFEQSLSAHFDPPLGILRIRRVRLEVPVLSGTDDLSLNRGVGLIAGTSRPGEAGTVGIAGHRDGFFRVLKDVGRGDIVELETIDRIDLYRVDDVVIVKPDDVRVLSPAPSPTLSLVTCYPFYFIGSAPQRYIVMASLERSAPLFDAGPKTKTTSVVLNQPQETRDHYRKSQSRRQHNEPNN